MFKQLLILFCLFTVPGFSQCLISGLSPSYCLNDPATGLTTSFAGGTLSGNGILNHAFSPSLAGVGNHTIQYQYCSTAYSVTSIPYTFTSNGQYVLPQMSDNAMSAAVPIGFNFRFFCDTFSQVYFSSNGFITFSPNQANGCCQGLALPAGGTSPKNMIALCWTDLDPGFGGTIRYELFGSAPNRVFMTNYNCVFHHNNGSGGDPVTGYILLYESTNVIEVHLAIKPAPVYTINATVGIQDNSGNLAYAVAGKNGTSAWSASYEAYRFTPGPNCSSTATTSVLNIPNVSLAWSKLKICLGESTALVASGANTYLWSNANTGPAVAVQPSVSTVYSVVGTAINGCSATAAVQVTVEACTALNEAQSALEFVAYPNPAASNLTLAFYNNVIKTANIDIRDVTGRLLLSSPIFANTPQQIVTKHFSNGLYLVNLIDSENRLTTKKIIINN